MSRRDPIRQPPAVLELRPGTDPPSASSDFMIAEHERLVQLFLHTRESAERRVTLYLTLVTAALAAVAAMFQFNVPLDTQLEFGLIAGSGLLLFGVITFLRLLERSMRGTEYLRAINRLHRYFVERDPSLEPYLYWPAYDNRPRYNRGSAGVDTREVVAFLDALCAAGLALLALLAAYTWLPVALISTGAVGFVTWRAHEWFARRRLEAEQANQAGQVRFPDPAESPEPPPPEAD